MTQCMLRLKTILQYKHTALIIFILILAITLIRISIPNHSNYDITTNEISGTLIDYKIEDDKLTLIIKAKEKVRCTYYIKEEEKINLKLGIKLKVIGTLKEPNENTIPNTFNYKKYLLNNSIFYTMNVDKVTVLNNKTNILYTIKNKINVLLNKYKSKDYLFMFITGNKTYLDESIYKQYQDLGVSHIFAISGMHVSILASIIFKLLYKLKENHKYYFVITFLLFYSFITNFTASILRSISLYICLFINKRFDLNLTTINVYYLAISILLILNPLIIFNIGFIYSSVISYSLIRYNYLIKGNYIMKCLKISTISFLFSLPISINNNYEINFLSIINNLFFVPTISFIIYPLSLLTLILPFLDNIYLNIMNVIEQVSNYLLIYKLTIPKLNIISIILYYIILHIFLISYQKKYLLILLSIILINKYSYVIDNNYYIYYLDVGQGDATLLKYKDESILIDTGGVYNYSVSDTYITFFKSIGITNIDYLILTHGDYDHLGESINLVNKFKINKVILNCGEINNLESNLIIELNKLKIPFYTCVKEINFNKNKLYFINNNLYDNENDNSIVIYTKLYNYQLLFMGDAGSKVEENILKEYNINNIDIIKVGHHGSYTSSSSYFINNIRPKYSIISVGKNNKYGHPHKQVLDNLKNTSIYRTDIDGTIMFKIKKEEIKKYVI